MGIKQELTSNESQRKCSILNSYITEYKAQHPNLSSNQIANRLGIPQASLNRIENRTTNPSLENVLNILIGTGNQESIARILEDVFPNQKEKFKQIFSTNLDTQFWDKKSTNFATKNETFLIMQSACTRNGITYDEVKERFGTYGIEQLNLLLDHKVLRKQANGSYGVDQEKINVTFSDLKKMLTLALEKCYCPEENSNHLSYQTESVNQEGLYLIFQELKRVQQNIKNILYNPKFFGKNKIFVGIVSDKIIKDDKDNENYNNYGTQL